MLELTKLSINQLGLLLQKCMKSKALSPSKQIHALVLTSGIGKKTLSLNPNLVGVYASCGDLRSAKFVFETMKNPNVFALNWMISASAFNGYYEEAIGYFSSVLQGSKCCCVPNKYTFSVVLKACVGLMDICKGKEIHGVVYKMGFEGDVCVGNALVDMYCKCGSMCVARKVFDGMPKRDVASWTVMICGCSSEGKGEPLVLFERMKLEGLKPNGFTWNAMITGFARRGDCDGALELFSRMAREGMAPDLVTWNALISGFVRSLRTDEAMELFRRMLVSGTRPNHVTVTGLLPAFGFIGSIRRGREIHGLIYRLVLYFSTFVASSLINMYSKCGSVRDAWNVFSAMPIKNVTSWNAMIGCFGKHGMTDSSLELFGKMQDEGLKANEITLISLLSACSHSNSVKSVSNIFNLLKETHGVELGEEHYTRVVDLLCRSGRLEEAYDLVKEMPTDSTIGAFLSGCKTHER